MATEHDKIVLIETMKNNSSTRSFTWMDWRNKKNAELDQFKEMLKPDWDNNSEKVFKKREEEVAKQFALEEEFIKFKFPEDKNAWKHDYEVTIIITKNK